MFFRMNVWECLGALRCTRVAQMEANIPLLCLPTRWATLILWDKSCRKAPFGNKASKIIWQHHYLHNAVRCPVQVPVDGTGTGRWRKYCLWNGTT